MDKLTLKDLLNLQEEFMKFTETAEQHQFIRLFSVETQLKGTIKTIKERPPMTPISKSLRQLDILLSFINVYTILGKPTEKYENLYVEQTKQYIKLLKEPF